MEATIEKGISEKNSGIEKVKVVNSAGENASRYAFILFSGKTSDIPALRQSIRDDFKGQGQTVEPFFFTRNEWQVLNKSVAEERWNEALTDMAAYLKSKGATDPQKLGVAERKEIRKTLEATLKDISSTLDFLEHDSPFPLFLTADFTATTLKKLFSLLLATKGQSTPTLWNGTDSTVQAKFAESFPDNSLVRQSDFELIRNFESLAAQSQLFYQTTAYDDDKNFQTPELFQAAKDFLRRSTEYIRQEFRSEVERARLAKWRKLRWGIVGLGFVIIALGWFVSTRPASPVENMALIKKPGSILGEYYMGKEFGKFVARRADTSINFHSNSGFHPEVPDDNFSIRWNGFLKFPEKGGYAICTESDDGARVFFNGKKIIDEWSAQPLLRACKRVYVEAGWYPIKVEYFEAGAVATFRLLRGPREYNAAIIPSKDLCCGE